MTPTDLTELLERAGERTHVGTPPIPAMVAHVGRQRRRRGALMAAGSAVAVAVIVAGTTTLMTKEDTAPRVPAPAGGATASASSPAVPSNVDLEGTWIVHALIGPDGQSVLPASARYKVRLTFAGGELTGTTGCNQVFGTYVHEDANPENLHFPRKELGSTLAACQDEPPLISRLLDVRHVSGSGSVRYLHAENWMIVVHLRRS